MQHCADRTSVDVSLSFFLFHIENSLADGRISGTLHFRVVDSQDAACKSQL